MTTDKTGAETTVSAADGKYTIAVDGQTVGLATVADRGNQRVFYHTEVDERFGGRGLATILVNEALEATRADGKRVVAVCPMVAAFLKKHTEGIQHLGMPVDDLNKAVADYEKLGYHVWQSGAWGDVGKKDSGQYDYMDTDSIGGVSVPGAHSTVISASRREPRASARPARSQPGARRPVRAGRGCHGATRRRRHGTPR